MAINPTPASITAGTLDAWEYLASYVDLMSYYGADQAGAANHYNLTGGPIEGRSITFNAWAYLASYVDLMSYFGYDAIGAAMHYVVTGLPVEGRTVTFDAQAYLDANPDLQAAYGDDADGGLSNAAYHYVVTGRAEIADGLRESAGQKGGETFELTAGVDLFPDGLDNSDDDTIIVEGGTLNPGDDLDGGLGTDTMRVEYAVSDLNQTLESLFDHAGISNIEVLEFDTNDDISFQANTADAADSSAGGDYDFTTFTLGSGDDTIEFNGETAAAYTVNGGVGNDMVIDRIGGANGANYITFIGGTGSDDTEVFSEEAAWDPHDSFTPGSGEDTVRVVEFGSDDPGGTLPEIDITAGEVAELITDGALEIVEANTMANRADIRVRVNDADLQDFSGTTAKYILFTQGGDVFFSANYVDDGTEGVNVTIAARNDIGIWGDILAVGGAGDDIITIVSGNAGGGTAGSVDGATDGAGIMGLRGADTINLEAGNANADWIVYNSAEDGAPVGGSTGFDIINNFEAGTDQIIFSVSDGSYVTITVAGPYKGFMGDTMDKDDDGVVDFVTDPFAIDLDTAELATFTGTTLSNAGLEDLTMVASIFPALESDTIGDVLVFSVQGMSNTGIYWFTSGNADGDVDVNELSILAVVDNALLTGADYAYG